MFFASDEDHRGKYHRLNAHERLAIEICARCPVSGNCLQAALKNPLEKGIWGGTTSHMRRALRRIRSRASCPRCMKGRLMRLDDGTQVCMNCGLSWYTE